MGKVTRIERRVCIYKLSNIIIVGLSITRKSSEVFIVGFLLMYKIGLEPSQRLGLITVS